MILDPASVSVLNEPYEKGLAQYNSELEAVLLEAHAEKLAAASRSRRLTRWLRRVFCCCMGPSIEDVPPVYTPAKEIPLHFGVGLDGSLVGTLERRRAIMQGRVKPDEKKMPDLGRWLVAEDEGNAK